MTPPDTIQIPRELLERLTAHLKAADTMLNWDCMIPVSCANAPADLRAVERLLSPICPQCGTADKMIKHADGQLVCHGTHIAPEEKHPDPAYDDAMPPEAGK